MYLSDDTKVLPFSCGLFPKSIQKPEEPDFLGNCIFVDFGYF